MKRSYIATNAEGVPKVMICRVRGSRRGRHGLPRDQRLFSIRSSDINPQTGKATEGRLANFSTTPMSNIAPAIPLSNDMDPVIDWVSDQPGLWNISLREGEGEIAIVCEFSFSNPLAAVEFALRYS